MESASWVKEKSATSLYPAQVETTLIQLNEAWPPTAGPLPEAIQNFPLGEAALLHLFAISSICAARIVQNPDLLLWLSQPEVCRQGRDQIEMANELYRMAGTDVAANKFRGICLPRHQFRPFDKVRWPSRFDRGLAGKLRVARARAEDPDSEQSGRHRCSRWRKGEEGPPLPVGNFGSPRAADPQLAATLHSVESASFQLVQDTAR